MRPLRGPALLIAAALLWAASALLPAGPVRAAAADEPSSSQEAARLNAIRGLKGKLRRAARGPYRDKAKPEILKHLEALGALGGKEAGLAALEAAPHPDAEVRDAAFALAEREHDKSFVGPLRDLLEDKDLRRDADVRKRIAHALAVVADPGAIAPLTDLIRFDEDAHVVAEASDALAGYASAPLKDRKPAVKALIDLYASTWNLKESVRAEHQDKLLKQLAQERYEVYGKSLRFALQALTGRQLTRPREWREWWNDNKKKNDWSRREGEPAR